MTGIKKYHFEIGLPKGFNGAMGVIPLEYTKHALEAAENDRYGKIKLPKEIDTNRAKVIEVEMRGREVLKVLYRVKCTKGLDLLVACMPMSDCFKVRTVWLNLASDAHGTLDASKYEKIA